MRLAPVLLAACFLWGCHDFQVPELPTALSVEGLQATPQRVGPGGTLTITFRTPGGGETKVAVNGLPARPVGSEGSNQEWSFQVQGDEGAVLNVVATAAYGERSATASTQVVLDTLPPAAPAAALLRLEARHGEPDRLSGAPGCVTGSDVRFVEVALDLLGQLRLARVQVGSDGSFPAVDLGDDAVSRVYVFALDDVGNRSPATALDNDTEGPRLVSLELAPRTPRSGLPVTLSLVFDEPVISPQLTLAGGSLSRTAELVGAGTAWTATVEALPFPAGPAQLLVTAADAAGNVRSAERSFQVAAAAVVDLAQVRLSRSATGWTLSGRAGSAPFPSQVEATLVQKDSSRLCGTRLVASNGSFEPIAIATSLTAADSVRLVIYDDGGTRLGEASVEVDVFPPTLVGVTVSPTVVGPTAPATITVESSEPIGLLTTVTVNGVPALRTSGEEDLTAAFTYAVTGKEPGDAVEVQLRDLAGNEAAPWSGALNLDLEPPAIKLSNGASSWAPPVEPPMSYQPPDQVRVTFSDPKAGVLSARWSAVNVRTGETWDGTQWLAQSPPRPLPVTGSSFDLPFKAMLPADERIEVTLEAEDTVGNSASFRQRVSRYANARWISLHPTYDGALAVGTPLTVGRVGQYGVVVISAVCKAGTSCQDAWSEGRLVSLFSKDGGKQWDTHDLGVALTDGYPAVWNVAYDSSGTHGLVSGQGVFLRLDERGSLAAAQPASPPDPDAYTVAWDGATAWVATEGGVFHSGDAGLTWSVVPSTASLGFLDLAAGAPGHLVAVGYSRALIQTRDGGGQWVSSQLTLGPTDLGAVAIMPDGTLYAGGADGLVKSADGAIWSPVDADAGISFRVTTIRPSRMGPIVHISNSGASDWKRLNPDKNWIWLWSSQEADLIWDLQDLDGWGTYGVGYKRGQYGAPPEQALILYSPSGGGTSPGQ